MLLRLNVRSFSQPRLFLFLFLLYGNCPYYSFLSSGDNFDFSLLACHSQSQYPANYALWHQSFFLSFPSFFFPASLNSFTSRNFTLGSCFIFYLLVSFPQFTFAFVVVSPDVWQQAAKVECHFLTF